MKTKFSRYSPIIIVALCSFISWKTDAQTNTFPSTGAAGIGTTTPNTSSLLEVKSTTKGILIPRMTQTQRNAIASPATGLLIYQTDKTPGFYYYSGSAWTAVSPKAKGWSLIGNAGTDSSINFVGTTDAHPLVVRVNNQKAGWIDYSATSANTGLGYHTLNLNTTGNSNAAFGYKALSANTTGSSNTANGGLALYVNTTGSNNTANGYASLYYNTTGYFNTANGDGALYSNTTGHHNTASGLDALYSDTSGTYNTADGVFALYSNVNGSFNTASGYAALSANTASSNTAHGYEALYYNTTGNYNTATGFSALYSNTTGNYNIANGAAALFSNTTGIGNTAHGYQALYYNTTGNYNTAIGYNALLHNTTGVYNTANGDSALLHNTIGVQNTATGYYALTSNTTGSQNTANGDAALAFNTTGQYNTADGINALLGNTSGSYNTAFGNEVLANNTTGNFNTALGDEANVSTGNLSNATAIGRFAIVDASNKVRIGYTDVTSIGGQVGWTTFSDGRYKKNIREDVVGLAFIKKLRPISYTVDINGLNDYYDKNRKHDDAYEKMKKDMQPAADEASKIVYNGFIAQEVEAAAEKLNYSFSGVDKPKTKDGLYGLRYSDFVVPLVKAVQELSGQNEELKSKNDSLQNDDTEMKSEIRNLKSEIDKITTLVLSMQQCSPCVSNASSQLSIALSSPVGEGQEASFAQNVPNPFNHTTIINYSLPQTYSSAKIIIIDKSGQVLKEVNIVGSGKGSLTVDASALASGAYNYSLFVDGKLIDTKQMILAK